MLHIFTNPKNFYPRPPRGGRHTQQDTPQKRYTDFYPRPPRGGRLALYIPKGALPLFLSTPSARRATFWGCVLHGLCPISIHALREEGDQKRPQKIVDKYNFYPRPPRGGRPGTFGNLMVVNEFLSTPSARRATPSSLATMPSTSIYFYPRPPRGGRR